MAAALEYLGEMDAAIARSSWNITVRHAQEVVELVMKAALGYLCIDYPKVHDTADVFIAALARRRMGLSDDEAADIRAVSSRLASKRAPAFSLSTTRRPMSPAPQQRTHGASTACVRGWPPPSKSDSGRTSRRRPTPSRRVAEASGSVAALRQGRGERLALEEDLRHIDPVDPVVREEIRRVALLELRHEGLPDLCGIDA